MSAAPRPVPEVGEEVLRETVPVTRTTLVRYAGASGDFNPIHHDDAVAASVDLPGVIAHGMATLGIAAALVETWAGGPGAVLDVQTRFARPVVVPAGGGTELEVTGVAGQVEGTTVRVDVDVRHEGVAVLTRARVLVDLARSV
ncbi:MaoC/PaaZ C-terminal domain-containing protein [Georgenia sp. Z1491]|uniref:MaoC/PaaZ C-terminal domain-containing protein n=1 Tax=Georgenia sp. Z1491 TaxID=3416707 RepID=UPI003CFAE5A4